MSKAGLAIFAAFLAVSSAHAKIVVLRAPMTEGSQGVVKETVLGCRDYGDLPKGMSPNKAAQKHHLETVAKGGGCRMLEAGERATIIEQPTWLPCCERWRLEDGEYWTPRGGLERPAK
jgi:hypothetical protein